MMVMVFAAGWGRTATEDSYAMAKDEVNTSFGMRRAFYFSMLQRQNE